MNRGDRAEKRRRRIERMKACIRSFWFIKRNFVIGVCIVGLCISAAALGCFYYRRVQDARALKAQQEALLAQKEAGAEADTEQDAQADAAVTAPEILPEYTALYEANHDLIGWLSIEGTNIDYPVMQTPEDEEYYLYRNFNGEENANGCLIMDTDSTVGVGTKEQSYTYLLTDQMTDDAQTDAAVQTTPPSTNLIIHGHTMQSGEMFGDLDLYADEAYGKEHATICFDSLYEHRKYELIAAFYSQVYHEQDQVFKFYKFFQADTQEEFDDWYDNIRALSLYDTGVSAVFGDEFLTLSCCSYQVENGRFVVVGKRVE